LMIAGSFFGELEHARRAARSCSIDRSGADGL
jgi:hypothetical protein